MLPQNIMRGPVRRHSGKEGLVGTILRIATGWANIATEAFDNLAHQGQTAYPFVDEVQNIPGGATSSSSWWTARRSMCWRPAAPPSGPNWEGLAGRMRGCRQNDLAQMASARI